MIVIIVLFYTFYNLIVLDRRSLKDLLHLCEFPAKVRHALRHVLRHFVYAAQAPPLFLERPCKSCSCCSRARVLSGEHDVEIRRCEHSHKKLKPYVTAYFFPSGRARSNWGLVV